MIKEAKENIKILVEKYEKEKASGRLKSYSEEETKKGFIEPFFEALGWNIYDKKEVSLEETISSKRVDYGFYLNDRIKFYLEAKKFNADLYSEDFANQTIRYSFNKGATWAVLTNFETLIIFNAQDIEKKLADKKLLTIRYDEYIDKFDKLWLLSKEAFEKDLLDKYGEEVGKKIEKVPISSLLYKDLQECREILIKDLSRWNKNVNSDDLDEGVQKILDRLLFIRVAEDRGVEPLILRPMVREYYSRKEQKGTLYQLMIEKFRELNIFYNSNLFSKHPFENWYEYGKTAEVINKLYGKEGYYEYDFKAMPSDVLGAVYENYLSHRLLKSKKGTTISKDASKRKEQGIYYTPSYIVDYIVKNALGPALDKCRSVLDVKKIKVLDPACGSGSFLIKAVDIIAEKYKSFGYKDEELLKRQIIDENIYGVDLDPQAVEITRLNLLINALSERIKFSPLKNIKNGNSLISGTDEELEKYFGKDFRDKKPFNWQEEFPEVFKQGGFDVIIGNPPYIRPHKLENDFKKYSWDYFSVFKAKSDIYAIFMQKAVDLLKNNGTVSFIVSNTWLSLESFAALRKYILDNCAIQNLVLLPSKVFEGATVETMIFNFKKDKDESQREGSKISIVKIDDNNDFMETQKIVQGKFLSTHLNMFDISHDKNSGLFLKKIEKASEPLQNYVTFYYGIKTGDDPKFISSMLTTKEHKKLLCRSDFKRYQINYNNEYVWYVPEIMRKNKITARPGEKQRFENYKIIIQDIGKRLVATLDRENYYIKDALILHQKGKNKLEYLLALINSQLLNYWYIQQFKTLSIAKNAFLILPIYKIDFLNKKEKIKHDELVKLADKILELNKDLQKITENSEKWNSIKSEIEKTDKKIDEEVYKLYNLTEEEIKIIEK